MGAPAFAHVVYQTSQLAAMKEWYCDLLEGHVVYEGQGLCFLTHDEEHHRVALIEAPEPLRRKTPDVASMHHTAYTFASLTDLVDRYEQLTTIDVLPVMPIQHGVTTSLYYEDPDGNHVEFQVDNFATPDEATAYMEGPEFTADPIGPRYSPDALLAAVRAGEPTADLTSRAWAARHPFESDHAWPGSCTS
jgi:catechol-2,3-dioxygenase